MRPLRTLICGPIGRWLRFDSQQKNNHMVGSKNQSHPPFVTNKHLYKLSSIFKAFKLYADQTKRFRLPSRFPKEVSKPYYTGK
jgi:hypothetical protein